MMSRYATLLLFSIALLTLNVFSYTGSSLVWNGFQDFSQYAYASSIGQNFCISGVCFPLAQTPIHLNFDFLPWGNQSLYLRSTPNGTGELIFEINGKTEDQSGGFISQDLNYTGRVVRLGIGEVIKTSTAGNVENPQITLVLNITGEDGKTHYYRFVDGYLTKKGWDNNDYYQNVHSNSSYTVEFDKVPVSKGGYKSLNNVFLVVQKGITIGSYTFSLFPEELPKKT